MSDNRGSKRTASFDDDGDRNYESTFAEWNDSSRRSPTFRMKPGPASWKWTLQTQPNPSQSPLGSWSRKPGTIPLKTASAVDEKTAANSPEATFQRPRNDSEDSKVGINDSRNEFIWLVRRFPHLYNPKDPFFKNATKKKEAWTAISVIVGMSVEDCRVRWKLLRDRYCRERKKKSEHIDPDFSNLMETELKFLDSIIRHRRTIKFSTSSPRRPSIDEEQTLQSTPNAFNPPASSVLRDDQDSRASVSTQIQGEQEPRIIMSLKTGKDGSTASPILRRVTNQSTPQSKPRGANAGNNSAYSYDSSTAEEENEEEEEEEEEEEDKETEEEGGDDDDNAGANRVQSRANGRIARWPIGPLNNAIPTLSRIKQTQDTDQLFTDTLAVIFRQFSPKDKNLILSKFLKLVVKMQRKIKQP